jgi:hypothetical protein
VKVDWTSHSCLGRKMYHQLYINSERCTIKCHLFEEQGTHFFEEVA